jgi:hypothetical protein
MDVVDLYPSFRGHDAVGELVDEDAEEEPEGDDHPEDEGHGPAHDEGGIEGGAEDIGDKAGGEGDVHTDDPGKEGDGKEKGPVQEDRNTKEAPDFDGTGHMPDDYLFKV